jgi:hypothetical protein
VEPVANTRAVDDCCKSPYSFCCGIQREMGDGICFKVITNTSAPPDPTVAGRGYMGCSDLGRRLEGLEWQTCEWLQLAKSNG